jgi:hypothetical protein
VDHPCYPSELGRKVLPCSRCSGRDSWKVTRPMALSHAASMRAWVLAARTGFPAASPPASPYTDRDCRTAVCLRLGAIPTEVPFFAEESSGSAEKGTGFIACPKFEPCLACFSF